jgi:chorismate mutase
MAIPSYRERMKAARAEARAKREAEKAARQRRVELMVTAQMMAPDAVKATIREVEGTSFLVTLMRSCERRQMRCWGLG